MSSDPFRRLMEGFAKIAEPFKSTTSATSTALMADEIRRLGELPSTTFRCDACGRRVRRFDPTTDGRRWRTRNPKIGRCPEHGELRDLTLDEWHAEWTRRGRKDRLNLRLSPVQ